MKDWLACFSCLFLLESLFVLNKTPSSPLVEKPYLTSGELMTDWDLNFPNFQILILNHWLFLHKHGVHGIARGILKTPFTFNLEIFDYSL